MDYSDYYFFDRDLKFYRLNVDSYNSLDLKKKIDVLSSMNSQNESLFRKRSSYSSNFIKHISTSDVVLAKNTNRKFDKSNVCLRLTNNVVSDFKKFAGELDVPVQDLMCYVLEYGLLNYRVIKEI